MPWLRAYKGATIVIKYGGNAMIDDSLKRAFAADVLFFHQVGLRPVVVICLTPRLRIMAGFERVRPDPRSALAELALLTPQEGPSLLYAPLVLLSAIGVVHLLRRRRWAMPVVWACAAGMVALAFFPVPSLSALIGGWWADPDRPRRWRGHRAWRCP